MMTSGEVLVVQGQAFLISALRYKELRGQLQIPASVSPITVHMRPCGPRSQFWRDVKENNWITGGGGVEPWFFSNPEPNHHTDFSAKHSRILV